MATANPTLDNPATGLLFRSAEEIAHVLTALIARGEPVKSNLTGGALVFGSKLRFVDAGREFIVLDLDTNEVANEALLARPRASLHATLGNWHIEFAAAAPQRVQHAGRAAIRLRFPEILVTQERRAHERLSAQPQIRLHFLADASGVISFDGYLVDISADGVGFQYEPNITLEPGTILRGCRIELPGQLLVEVDLEVRYSLLVTLPDGERAMHSGCRFVNPSGELKALCQSFFGR